MFEESAVAVAFEAALAAADHLAVKHAATVATARHLARRVDSLCEFGWVDPDSGKLDNVTVPTFLKFLDALGLVVERQAAKPGPASTASPSQLAINEMRERLRAV